jgi:hypothetical protein
VIREAFVEAKAYKAEWDAYDANKTGIPPRKDLKLEALKEVLEGKRYVHAHSYRADEILMLLRVADEFGFKIRTLQHVLDSAIGGLTRWRPSTPFRITPPSCRRRASWYRSTVTTPN